MMLFRQKAPLQQPETARLTETVIFGKRECPVFYVDEARGIRRKIIDEEARFCHFPGIEKGDWMKAWESKRPPENRIRFRTAFERHGDRLMLLWEIQPDGRYWGDDSGFGAENEVEITLCTFVDAEGFLAAPFRVYNVGMKHYPIKEGE